MRIAIHNHYAGQEVAETEFAQKIARAASNLGWQAIVVGNSQEINVFKPDFVLALHFRTPKLTQYPTYGSMVTPPAYFAQDDQFVKHILSYDGYFSSSDHITGWVRSILYRRDKQHLVVPFYTSCQSVPYCAPHIGQPRLVYTGTNWDGQRHKELFLQLDKTSYTDVYGPSGPWSYLSHSYRGTLPFDGSSILEALNRAGVGLCLHRPEHCAAATPSTRIFEIAASGAIAICQEHGFIREAFGDSVLYLDPTVNAEQTAAQIAEYMTWIQENPEHALQLSKRAYDIFSQDYTLEKLLSDAATHHMELVEKKAFPTSPTRRRQEEVQVQYIVRVGHRDSMYIHRALDSLACQTAGRIGVLLVRYGDIANLDELPRRYGGRLEIDVVESPRTGFRSTQLWAGLSRVSTEYFGILDDDDILYPNHVHCLLRLLGRSEECGVAYSGSVRTWERDGENLPPSVSDPSLTERSELSYFEPFDLNRLVGLENYITSNAFIARASLLKNIGEDPRLHFLEDLFLLLHLSQQTQFLFSYEATCQFYWREHKQDNATWESQQGWKLANDKIKTLLWKRSFDVKQTVGLGRVCLLEDLSHLETRLGYLEAHLEQTKATLDATTNRVNRYTNLPFISVVRRLRRRLFRLPPPGA